MKQKLKQTKGITLIALVITIIVLLILAGVSIAMLTGENGILTQANKSKIEQSHGAVREGISLAYNEYQIEINTASNGKIASKEIVTIKGEEEKAKSGITETFLQFLDDKGYIRDGTTDVLNVEALTGSKQALGNGTNTDIYKIEEENGKYIVNYYDDKGTTEQIWSIISNTTNTETGDLTLEPDTGKEALILVYNVSAGDEIELPYSLQWEDTYGDDRTVYYATYNFHIDWGDGNTANITNENIESLAIHQYDDDGIYEVKITGNYDILAEGIHINNLVKVAQWGTTGLKVIDFMYMHELTEIVSPTENSFNELKHISFGYTDLGNIPENLLAKCPNLTSLNGIFDNTKVTQIPKKLFVNCSNVTDFSHVFAYTNITEIPENLFENCSNAIDFSGIFMGTLITDIPEDLFANCPNVTNFTGTFAYTTITSIPENLFANCPNVTDFGCTFERTEITTIPENLFTNCQNVEDFGWCFAECSNLTGDATELWKRVPNGEETEYKGVPDGEACFAEAIHLNNYEGIPDYWKLEPPPM